MSNAPIGIFDSGVGGLTVARAILDQLPNESTIYIGDTARGPYGPRPLAEVREFALETLDFLVEQGVKAIVIACNTASAAMLRDARERYKVPVIEVIVGDGEGQVSLRKLQKHLQKQPKKLTAHQMREVRARLKAVGGLSMPIPKGPMPTRAPKIR